MDYLKKNFHESLSVEGSCYVKEGLIYIRDKRWAPEDILQAFSDETYEDVFAEWLDERNQELLGVANEILEHYDQSDRFLALQQAYERGFVVPFAGAGLSAASGYPLWTPLLVKLASKAGVDQESLAAELDSGHYEEAAELVATKMGVSFNEELENTYGLSRPIDGAVQYFPYVFDSAIVTTNFDDVLKRCYENKGDGCAFEEIIAGHAGKEAPRYLAAGRRVLVKLHGTGTSDHGRSLTYSEYQQHYEADDVISSLVEALCSRTLLFFGCSLHADRFLSVLSKIAKQRGHDHTSRHYAFLEDPGVEAERVSKRQALEQCNIFIIWYPVGQHDESIEAFLRKLKGGSDD